MSLMARLRILFLLVCVTLVVCAIKFERHEVASLAAASKAAASKSGESGKSDTPASPESPGNATVTTDTTDTTVTINGLEFTEASTVDGFLLKKGVLYDLYSLKPVSSQTGAKLDVEKKCPT